MGRCTDKLHLVVCGLEEGESPLQRGFEFSRDVERVLTIGRSVPNHPQCPERYRVRAL
ncbi:hypothetical protein BQ8420_13970 [Nocardiopsis sp. JB363]|nr:hypothetical protein BQ8420_13970 [Nocardiopsis sp. JB363]